MLNRFLLVVILLSVVVFGQPSSGVEDSFSDRDSLEDERYSAEFYRNTIERIIVHIPKEDRADSLKKVVEEAEAFDQKSSVHHVFRGNDKLVIKYFLKDFEFLSQVDSVEDLLKGYIYGDRQAAMRQKLRREIYNGDVEEALKEVPDESDRVFIYIVLNILVEGEPEASYWFEEKKSHLTNKKQLNYLVNRYERKVRIKKRKSNKMLIGVGGLKPLGDIADTLSNSGFGINCGQDWIRGNLLYEFLATIDFFDTKKPDSWRFADLGFHFSFGYKLTNWYYLNLFATATVGISFNYLGNFNDENGKNVSPIQFYPTFGANLIADIWPNNLSGLRFRGGVNNLWSDKVVKSSGARLYLSIEWLVDLKAIRW